MTAESNILKQSDDATSLHLEEAKCLNTCDDLSEKRCSLIRVASLKTEDGFMKVETRLLNLKVLCCF